MYEVEGERLSELYRVRLPSGALGWSPGLARCFEPGGDYAWTVGARSATGETAWSEPTLFSVGEELALAELHDALGELRHHLGSGNDAVPESASELLPVSGPGRRDGGSPLEASGVELPRILLPPVVSAPAGGPLSAPDPLTEDRSLNVDSNIELGAASNLFKDGELLLWTDRGRGKTAIGHQALASSTLGFFDTAVGHLALQDNAASLTYNTAVGAASMTNTTTGARNSALGSNSLFSNTTGSLNTAIGYFAMVLSETGSKNTALGFRALASNGSGEGNTAVGAGALLNSSGADFNTAVGLYALEGLTNGAGNTAVGTYALRASNGSENTAVGDAALRYDSVGTRNTAVGAAALYMNSDGIRNTAVGADALRQNETGTRNAAVGEDALLSNTSGSYNTAMGDDALRTNSTGARNTAIGEDALYDATGSNNIGLGEDAGKAITNGDFNIMIGNDGLTGDANTIRIGTGANHAETFVAGIRGVTPAMGDGLAVYVDSAHQLGTSASTRRVKKDVESMGSLSDRLLDLRPVTFRFRQPFADGSRPMQFGLIAEEVAEVFPELVVRDDRGQPVSVRYQRLAPLLLNELQRQDRELERAVRLAQLGLALAVAVSLLALRGRAT